MHVHSPGGGRNGTVSSTIRASLCCAWFLCCAAHASEQQVIVEGGLRMAGTVRASGHDVPLLRALEQILPASYSVNVPNAGAWADAPVSWHAGETVTHVLGEVLSVDPTLQARVDTDLHLVTVTAHARRTSVDAASIAKPLAPAAAVAAAPTPASETAGIPTAPPLLATVATPASSPSSSPIHTATQLLPDANPSASEANAAVPAPVPAPPPEQTEWQLRTSDGSVRNALARWASEAGWQFVWNVPTDFEIDATATVHGTLEDALRQVTNALAGSQVPIQVVLYKRNRVMRVVPKGAS